MFRRVRQNKAFAIMEYFVLFLIVTGSLYIFRDYFLRAVAGKWKTSGDQFGQGRQFDPTDTVECAYEPSLNQWYDVTCFENKNCPVGSDGCQQQAKIQCANSFCTND